MPELPPEWQRVVEELRADRAAQKEQLDQMVALLADNNRELKQLRKMLRRRETQLKRAERENRTLRKKLGLPDPDDDPEPTQATTPPPSRASRGEPSSTPPDKKKTKPRTRGGRRPPPPHLSEEVEQVAVCACGACGGEVWRKDVQTTRLYTKVQAHVRCRVIQRERVVCTACGTFTTAPMPPMPAKRTLYDARFLAWVVANKFELLVPLDRIRLQLQAQGIELAMGTLVFLVARAAELVAPIVEALWQLLKAGPYVAFDGTGIKVLIPGQTKAWDGYLEVFTRDEISVFAFDVTKHADGLAERLDGVEVPLLCDAESRNRTMASSNVLVHCNAHPLRAYREALKVRPKLAAEGLAFLGELYDLEDKAEARGLTGEELRAFRQEHSVEVLERYRAWLVAVQDSDPLPSDPVGKVVTNTLNHWAGLTRFVDDPALPLDNNESEREFQRHAKLRLASLFAGSVEGAERWALLLGVVRTAQKCGVDVEDYLTWVFDHMGTHRDQLGREPEELTPMAYREFLAEQGARAA
jgi:transposase